jgi:chloramphenicol 3-O-phosphotransferase
MQIQKEKERRMPKPPPQKLSPLEQTRCEQEYLQVVEELLTSCAKQEGDPIAIILGGQPGSGKTFMAKKAREWFAQHGCAFIIDIDKLRERHPCQKLWMKQDDKTASDKTHEVVSEWGNRLFLTAVANRRHILMDQTSKSKAKLARRIAELKEAEYTILFWVMSTQPELSWMGVLLRYEVQKALNGTGTARYVPDHLHDSAVSGVSEAVGAVEKDFLLKPDFILITNREGKVVYDNEWQSGNPDDEPSGKTKLREFVQELMAQPFSQIWDNYAEWEVALSQFDRLKAIIAKQIIHEKNQPTPNQSLIASWQAESQRLEQERNALGLENPEAIQQVMERYTPVIRRYYELPDDWYGDPPLWQGFANTPEKEPDASSVS